MKHERAGLLVSPVTYRRIRIKHTYGTDVKHSSRFAVHDRGVAWGCLRSGGMLEPPDQVSEQGAKVSCMAGSTGSNSCLKGEQNGEKRSMGQERANRKEQQARNCVELVACGDGGFRQPGCGPCCDEGSYRGARAKREYDEQP